MSFAAPTFLLGLLVIPLLLAAWLVERRRRRRYVVRFPATAVLASVTRRAPAWRRWLTPALLSLAAAALVLALAKPRATVAVPIEQASVVLVSDASGSMRATDVAPTRLRAAQGAAERFLDSVPDTLLVGFVSYSSSPSTVVDPTLDHVAVRTALVAQDANGGTATGDALTAALDRLERRRADDGSIAPAAIVLLSDGKTTAGSDPLEAAARAGDLDIPIYTVALGTADGVIYNGPFGGVLQVPPDPETLRQIAEISGGAAFRVDDASELDRVYERLGSQIGTRDEEREISSAFAGAGLLILAGALLAGLRWRPRLP